MIQDPLQVFIVLAAVVFGAVWLERRNRIVRALSAALVGILTAMLLSNLGVIPGTSRTYDLLSGPGTSVAIALILLSVDLRSVVEAGPKMVLAFLIGAIGTAFGAFTSGLVLAPFVGPETWKLAGQYTGTYTGGGMNYAALGQALETSGDAFTAGMAADVLMTAIWMVTCLAVPVIFAKANGSETATGPTAGERGDRVLEHSLALTERPVPLTDLAALVGMSLSAVWLAGTLATDVGLLPEVLWLTTLCVVIAQIPAVKRLTGGAMFGNYILLLFLASNGAQSVVANIARIGPAVFYFALGTVALHGLAIFGLGRIARIDFGTLAVASQANVGGAASAMAMAGARGYVDRILPGIAVGLLGYAVGNYSGFAVASLLRTVLGA